MATCQMCGGKAKGFLTEVCEACASKRKSDMSVAPAMAELAVQTHQSEGDTAKLIGNALISLSLVSSVICIFAVGRVPAPDGVYGTKDVWAWPLIIAIGAAGANGVFFGYLLSKVGSVLRRLENMRQ